MRLLLPVILLMFGALLFAPVARAAVAMSDSGTPDATALSMDNTTLIQGGIGAALVIVGLVLFIIRITRRSPAHSA